MTKFLVLYLSAVPAKELMAKTTPEEGKKGMEMWMAWAKKAGTSVVDLGAPLGPVGSANGKVTGFSILQGESVKAVEALLKEHPHRMAPGASIEVHELLKMPGM